MAFNWPTFKTRALTAVVFVVVMLAGLLTNAWTFFILFSIIHFGCWIEYQKLVKLKLIFSIYVNQQYEYTSSKLLSIATYLTDFVEISIDNSITSRNPNAMKGATPC